MQRALPFISVVIPTLNSARTLRECLESVCAQEYPAERLEVLIADGVSVDATIDIIKLVGSRTAFGVKAVPNPLKTGEAGKAAGLKYARGELVGFIDSDNVLPDSGWMRRMIGPVDDPEVAAAEP